MAATGATMNPIVRLVLRWLTTSLGMFAAVWLLPGVDFSGPGWQLGVVAAIFGLVTTLLRPLLTLLTCPLVLLTFGLFLLVINAGLLALTAWIAGQVGVNFQVTGFWPAVGGAIVVALVSVMLNWLAGDRPVRVVVMTNDR